MAKSYNIKKKKIQICGILFCTVQNVLVKWREVSQPNSNYFIYSFKRSIMSNMTRKLFWMHLTLIWTGTTTTQTLSKNYNERFFWNGPYPRLLLSSSSYYGHMLKASPGHDFLHVVAWWRRAERDCSVIGRGRLQLSVLLQGQCVKNSLSFYDAVCLVFVPFLTFPTLWVWCWSGYV